MVQQLHAQIVLLNDDVIFDNDAMFNLVDVHFWILREISCKNQQSSFFVHKITTWLNKALHYMYKMR